jgi:ABC-2 type transport system permease protein
MLFLAFLLPLMLALFGSATGGTAAEIPPILSGFLGMVLFTLSFVSVGMAASSFTENQIVAAITSVVALLILYLIHAPAELVGGRVADVLNYLSPIMQTKDLITGVISLKALAYFGSLIVLGLFISERTLDAQRWR